MFDNYFKIALRNIWHRKSFTAINLIGLSIGISAIVLISFYLKNELSYDKNTVHHEQVYRLMNHYRAQVYSNMHFDDYYGTDEQGQMQLINHIKAYEEVEQACHFVPSQSSIGGGDQYFVEFDDQRFIAQNVLYTNTGQAFQDIFPQEFLLGTPEAAFTDFQKITITRKLAEKWFGKNWNKQDILGKQLTIREEIFELAAVIENVPDNVHYEFDWIVHQQKIPSWGAYTYLKLSPNSTIDPVMTRLNQEADQVYPGFSEDVLRKEIQAINVADIHFNQGTLYELKPVANKTYLLTFGLVGLVILLIILTNYTNLSIAMYADRQKELGVRKVMGAQARDISFQLLAEAILLALICFPICIALLSYVLPYFNELMGLSGNSTPLFSAQSLLAILGLLLFTGMLSGIYPALSYGRRSMLKLFSGRLNQIMGKRIFNFRNALITTQFAMVIGLLSVTAFIYQQMQFVQNKDLGFQKEGIIYLDIDGEEKYKQLKTALMAIPEIEAVGANSVPGDNMYNQLTYKMKDTETSLADGTEQYFSLGTVQALKLQCDACQQLEQGKEKIFVINQTAAEKLAKIKGVKPEELIGETLITEPEWENEEFGYGIHHTIDGIIDDYKYFSLKYPNQSLLLSIVVEPRWAYQVLVRANTDRWDYTLQKIEAAYEEVETVRPFDFNFLEDRLNLLYASERRAGWLIAGLSLVAVILALMGLAGMVSYVTYGRQKEIGIRKILGASAGNILFNFNKEFGQLMLVATLIAAPIASYLSYRWLESFAFHIQPQIWVTMVAGIAALLLVIGLVSTQSLRAANRQPVEVLRSE